MASKKKKATPKSKNKGKAATPKPKKREPPVAMVIRRNAAPVRVPAKPEPEEEPALMERLDAWNVASGVGGAVLGQAVGVAVVGQGWLGPKLTSSLILGTGLAVAGAGYYWEVDHLLSGGAGMATAGALALTNQVAVDSYLRIEERADKKRAEKEAKEAEEERQKRLTEARALLESEGKKKPRNARRIVVLDHEGQPTEAEHFSHAAA